MLDADFTHDLPPPYEVDDNLPTYALPPSETPHRASERSETLDAYSVAAFCVPRNTNPLISNYPAPPRRAITRARSLSREEYAIGTHPRFLRSNACFSGPRTASSTQGPATPRFCRHVTTKANRRSDLKGCICFFLIAVPIITVVMLGLYFGLKDVNGLVDGSSIPAHIVPIGPDR
jgi:hypothetical protein